MKKIKIMLLSLALFAVVGGALAFKAKYTFSYCTTKTIINAQGQVTCPITPGQAVACVLWEDLTTTNAGGVRFCTTSANAAGDCVGKTTCSTLSRVQDDF